MPSVATLNAAVFMASSGLNRRFGSVDKFILVLVDIQEPVEN